jgi:ribosomal-protein-alanine N-acetyltransferase
MCALAEMTIATTSLILKVQMSKEVLATISRMSAEDQRQVSPEWLARVNVSSQSDPWTHGFVIFRHDDMQRVGQCGFCGPPASDGIVEIAYGVDVAFQGRGFATDAANVLVSFAFADQRVVTVLAHTLPQENASTCVLRKCGFCRAGESIDHEAGPVWRWARHKTSN